MFIETCTEHTELVFAVDDDDPTLDEYSQVARELTYDGIPQAAGPFAVVTCSVGVVEQPKNMVWALNQAAGSVAARRDPPFAVGFMGDDHRPRTQGWDTAYLDALRELGTGIVYGDDLLQRGNLPTQCAMTPDIIRALGFMAPPVFTHLYIDNYWLQLGLRAKCIRYLPNVVVEHCHPVAGKAQWDEGYARVNNSEMYAKDARAFRDYLEGPIVGDGRKVWDLRSVNA